MIYLDNSATTRKKPRQVVLALNKGATKYNANPGRGGHKLSVRAGNEVFKTRSVINNFVNGYGEENVVFTYNCTDALNLAILGGIKRHTHVITSIFEHNSVLRPLKYLESLNEITLTIIKPFNGQNIEVSDISSSITTETSAIVLSHVSNLTGAEINLKNIGEFCITHKLMFIVDAAQSAGHKKIDMQKYHIDMIALAGHKGLYGTMGIGSLIFNPKIEIKPIRFGGTGTHSAELLQNFESPEVFESGTENLPAIMALSEGIKFVQKNVKKIDKKTKLLSKYTLNSLKNNDNIIVYTTNDNGVIAFNHKKYESTILSQKLDKKNICVRAGLHCAPLMHEFLGTKEKGAVRLSIGYFNKLYEIKKFIKVINKIN